MKPLLIQLFILLAISTSVAQCDGYAIGDYFLHHNSNQLLQVTEFREGQLESTKTNKKTYEIQVRVFDCDKSVSKYNPEVGDVLELGDGKTVTVNQELEAEKPYFSIFRTQNNENISEWVSLNYLERVVKVYKKAKLNIVPFKVGDIVSWKNEDQVNCKGEVVSNYDYRDIIRIQVIDRKGYNKILDVQKSLLLFDENEVNQVDTIRLLARTYTSFQHIYNKRLSILKEINSISGKKKSFSFKIMLQLYNEGDIISDDRYAQRMYSFKNGGLMPADRYSFSYRKMPMTVRRELERLDYDWEFLGNGKVELSNKDETMMLRIVSISEKQLVLQTIDLELN